MSEEVAREIAGAVKGNARLMKLMGIATIVLGVLCLAAPLVAGVAVVTLVGVFLIAGGILRGFLAFKAGSFGKGVWAFLLGVLTGVCGLVMVGRPLLGLASLTLILVAYFLVDGISEIATAFQARPVKGWGWMLVGGIVSVLLAFMIWSQWPLSGAWAIGTLVGIKLIFAGWAEIALGAVGSAVGAEIGSAVESAETGG